MALSARDIYASYGDTTRDKTNEQMVIVNKKVICNELLSNVLRGITHCPVYNITDEFMIESLDPIFGPDAVHEARRILYKNFYTLFPDDPNDPNEVHIGSKEREIRKKDFLLDIIDKMRVVSEIEHDIEFCVPWDYKFIIVSDEEKRFRDIIKEKDAEIDTKFEALEKAIELQNRATIMAVESVMKKAMHNVKDVIDAKNVSGISSPVFEEAEFYKGAAEGIGVKSGFYNPGSLQYIPKAFDVQILNSLMIFVFFCFVARIAQRFLMMISISI